MFRGRVVSPLRQTREARGWSSSRVRLAIRESAARFGFTIAKDTSLRVMLSRWENGHDQPDATYRILLEDVFDLPADALGIDSPAVADPPDSLQALVARVGRHLDWSSSLGEYFTAQLAQHARMDNLTGPSYVIHTAGSQFQQLNELARQHGQKPARVAARFAEFLGWLHQDLGDGREALQLTNRAYDLALLAGDDESLNYTLMRRSNVLSAVNDRQLAASAAHKALETAKDRFPAMIPVCLRQVALTSAQLRDQRTTRDAVDVALAMTGDDLRGEDTLAAYCTRSYVRMEAALCLLNLQQPKDAEAMCSTALTSWPAELPRDRALCLVRRSVALAELREVDEACTAAMQAVEGVRLAPSGRTIHMLRLLTTRLQPFSRKPNVRELTEAVAEIA